MLQVFLAGNLGRDAELRQAGDGTVCSFSVATERKERDNKITTWVDCSIWGKRGESLAQYLSKGQKVAVTGELSTREHNGKTYLKCRVSEVKLLGGPSREGGEPRENGGRPESRGSTGGGYDEQGYGGGGDDDMIPFGMNVSAERKERWWNF